MKRLWAAWKGLARRIGTLQARVLLTILYVVLVFPFGLAIRLFSDPLRIKHRPRQWLDRGDDWVDPVFARKQS